MSSPHHDLADSTLMELLRERATSQPQRQVFTFLADGETSEIGLTYRELDQRARAIAAAIQASGGTGERVILFCPPGLDYVAALFGCLYAGAVAVPAFPPRPARSTPRLEAIVVDAQPAIALATKDLISNLAHASALPAPLDRLGWLAVDEHVAGADASWSQVPISRDTLAILQYTSGSTRTPRGVMLSHHNLMSNLTLIVDEFNITPDDTCVCWLPSYHDLGLIGGILQPVAAGTRAILMSPASFLQRPMRWLKAITRYQGTITAGPNFAYQLCLDRIVPDQLDELDLNCLRIAFCGAEPIRPETVRRFTTTFASCGFRSEAFYPCYGLAEATLTVSGRKKSAQPLIRSVRRQPLGNGRVVEAAVGDAESQTLVASGQIARNQRVIIVNPETLAKCDAGQVGEIWVAGASVGAGYWNRPEETERVFRAYTLDGGEGPFLRTGDLGFLDGDELFVTGRLKDLLIIRGRNLYPQDIELTVERSHAALRPGFGAAFTIEADDQERLVVAHELQRRARQEDNDEILRAICDAIAAEHELLPHAVVLLKPGSIPTTSSGKIQRYACRESYLAGDLDVVREWRQQLPYDQSSMLSPGDRLQLPAGQAEGLAGSVVEGHGHALASPSLTFGAAVARPVEVEPIAIVGLGCRFPGADNPEAFWQLLHQGVDAITEVPPERWDVDAIYDPNPGTRGKTNSRWGGFLREVDRFDALFFGISPREAARMDPQQRLLLEVTWEALENGGQAPDRLAGSRTGVFIGISTKDYSQIQLTYEDHLGLIDAYSGTGNAHSIAANRLSYLLDLRGPSLAVDTACSSSLVALHLACQSLQTGQSDLAIAGGVNLILAPELTVAFSHARMLAADGRCKTFDARADGYVRAEGCGIVVLKRLSDAVRNSDNILALVRGSAVNQDGLTSGITAPSDLAQQAVIREALHQAGIEPHQLSYIEAHGTGTPLGDPVEISALAAVVGEAGVADFPCLVGSVKANIGHTESASGIAGVIKTVLCLKYGGIPRQLHLEQLNSRFSLLGTRLVIPTEPQRWDRGEKPRFAGVNSFGFGGTNAHVVLEEAPEQMPTRNHVERPLHLLSLSAKSEAALKGVARCCERHLGMSAGDALADICFTANAGRSHFTHRIAVIGDSIEELREALRAYDQGMKRASLVSGQVPGHRGKLAWLFTGQGSQYPGMGRRLYETQPTFRRALDRSAEMLSPYLEHSLQSVLYPPLGLSSQLDETGYTQPALFAIEYALAQLWQSWGIEPGVVLGHSVGEYVAACIAGAFSLEDGLKLIAERSRLMQALPRDGMMAAVFAPEQRVLEALAPHSDHVSIAAINGVENIVISGARQPLLAALADLKAERFLSQPLIVSHAFHSPLMEPMLDVFEQVAGGFSFQPLRLPLVSNLTGEILPAGYVMDASYWRRHVRETVRFAGGINTLAEQGFELFLEVGPTPTLIGMAKRCLPNGAKATWLTSLKRDEDDWRILLNSLAVLYTQGMPINWTEFDGDYQRRRISLTTYPFERERYWVSDPAAARGKGEPSPRKVAGESNVHPLLGQRLRSAQLMFESTLSTNFPSYLDDHRIEGVAILPAAAYVEIALEAARHALGSGAHSLMELQLQKGMFLPENGGRTVQVTLSADSSGRQYFHLYSCPEGADQPQEQWTLHATGKLQHDSAEISSAVLQPTIQEIQARCTEQISGKKFYLRLRDEGFQYGPAFQGIAWIWRRDGEALGQLQLPRTLEPEIDAYQVHPAILDALFQVLAAALPRESAQDGRGFLPIGIDKVQLRGQPSGRLWGHARLQTDIENNGNLVNGDIRLLNEEGQTLVEVTGLRLQRLIPQRGASTLESPEQWLYEVAWQPKAQSNGQPAAAHSSSAGTWLIFADRQGIGEGLSALLAAQGNRCVLISPGDTYEEVDGERFRINPAEIGEMQRMLGAALGKDGPICRGVIHLWSLDAQAAEEAAADTLAAAQRIGCIGVLHLVQALAQTGWAAAPRLWLVTRGVQRVGANVDKIAVAQSPLWGLGRVIVLEHPEFRCASVDLDVAGAPGEIQSLFHELWQDGHEDQIALRREGRFVARLVQRPPQAGAAAADQPSANGSRGRFRVDQPFRLTTATPGTLDSLTLEPLAGRAPGHGEITIQVHATGLNFRDVMKALGVYPASPTEVLWLGDECAGKIVAVGAGVEEFQVGDEVIAVAPGAFSTFATTSATFATRKPAQLGFEEAATIPIAFMTAYYALIHVGRLAKGECILIHAATGGVGLAAIQIAQWIGAEIFATAGSPQKRDFLRARGIQHIMDSRSLDFADEVMQRTEGRGVDVVLNSLAGEALSKSLSTLGAYGRFLEIGKRDIYQNSSLSLRPFGNNLSFSAIDMDRLFRERPDFAADLFRQVMRLFDDGALSPLPYITFPVTEAHSAFRYMAQAKHIGKIVVSLPPPGNAGDSSPKTPTLFAPDVTYLITGGLGSLGLLMARWLVERGARYLVLVGRTARDGASPAALESLGCMEEAGAQVLVARADVAEEGQVARLLAEIDQAMPPLRGVIHAAGALDDGLLLQLDRRRFESILAPKVYGAWNLHSKTAGIPLDFFVLFSSAASLLGSPGQGNYAAANAFLDALAHHRQLKGHPGLSINWGPWSEIGMAARLEGKRSLALRGIKSIPPQQGLEVLERLLQQNSGQVAVLPFDWGQWRKLIPAAAVPALLADLADREANALPGATLSRGTPMLTLDMLLTVEPERRQALLEAYLQAEIARVLEIDEAALDLQAPLRSLGLDSLLAFEVKNFIEANLGATLPMVSFFHEATISMLASQMLDLVATTPSDAAAILTPESDAEHPAAQEPA